MKKVIALLLALCLALAMTACGGSKDSAASPAASAAASGGANSGKTYKVAMICDSSISDGGWGAACYNGMMDASKKYGWQTAYTDSIDQSAYATAMISYCDLGYDMIFVPGNQYSDAVKQVAADYPKVYFAVLNGGEDLPTKNIDSILPDAKQIGSIAGIIAGTMSKTGVIGFIGGMELDTTKAKLANFESAAKSINPNIKAVSAYAGSFNDTAKGMELAASMINQNADVFFGDASAVDSGARQAIDKANNGTVKIIDIGQPADLLGQNPCVACSVITDNGGMLGLCMKAVEEGSFGNKVIYGTLDNGCVYLGAFNNSLIDSAAQAKITDSVKKLQASSATK